MTSSHHKPDSETSPNAEVAVDAALEVDMSAVEEAVATYLGDRSDAHRHRLLSELQTLDEQIELGDDYTTMPLAPGALGYLPNAAIGATSASSAAEAVPDAVFRAQVTLVNAAKQEVRRPTMESLEALRAAAAALDTARARGPDHVG